MFSGLGRKLKGLAGIGVGKLEELIGQIGDLDEKDRQMIEHAVAVAAGLTAGAHGQLKPEEAEKIQVIISLHKLTKGFDGAQFMATVTEVVKNVEMVSMDFALSNYADDVNVLKSIPALANVSGQLCVEIASADGDFDADEAEVVKTIFEKIGLNPNEFPKLRDALDQAAAWNQGSTPTPPTPPQQPARPTPPAAPAPSTPPANNPDDDNPWS